MKIASWIVALAVGAGCSAAGPRAPASSTTRSPEAPRFAEVDRAAVAQVLADQSAAWNRGDLQGYMAGYVHSSNLVFTSGAKVRTGYDETFAAYRQRYGDDRASMGVLEFKILRVDPVGADGAVVLGRWDLQRPDGPVGGIFSVVLERTRQGWLIVHDHTSADAPAP